MAAENIDLTLEDILLRIGGLTDFRLNQVVSDEHIDKIADKIDNWPNYAQALGLKRHQQEDIRTDIGTDYLMKIKKVFTTWKDNVGFKATYKQLAEAALSLRDGQVAITVCRLCKECQVDDSPNNFPSFVAWLKFKGISDKDIKLLNDEGFCTEQAFATLEADDLTEIHVTRGGRKLLLSLIEEVKERIARPAPQIAAIPVSQSAHSTSAVPMSSSAPMIVPRGALNEVNNEVDYSKIDCSRAYNTMVKCSVILNQTMSRDPKNLALALYSEGFISQATLDETNELNETKNSKGSRLYSAVLGRVRSFPKKFADFVVILRRNRALYGDVLSEIDTVYNNF